jgi:hypothetical protein
MHVEESSDHPLVASADRLHGVLCDTHLHLLRVISRIDAERLWDRDGARDMAHWLWMRYGISDWKARRWLDAARALPALPRITEALGSGRLGIDKAVELTRFATADTEADLLPWAERVSAGAIRARGDREARRPVDDAADVERSRGLGWWHEDEGRVLRLEGTLPAQAGAILTKALDRVAERLPVMPGEASNLEARRADALVALASGRIAADPDQDRATVVVHVPFEVAASAARPDGSGAGEPGCAVEGGGIVPAETARRLLCTARIETVVEDGTGRVIGLGRTSREPSEKMLRVLRHRDGGCRFPGCGSRRYTHAHHIRWWSGGGTTDLENLVLVCGFHHRLVHEHGWRLRLEPSGDVLWFRADGRRYLHGPGSPRRSDASDERAGEERAPPMALIGV